MEGGGGWWLQSRKSPSGFEFTLAEDEEADHTCNTINENVHGKPH